MSDKDEPSDPLARYAEATGKSDAAIGRLIKASRWKISRARRGEHELPIEDQIALQEYTGVTPEVWTAFYAKMAKKRALEKEAAEAEAARKTGAAKKARRPFAASPEPEPAQ